jgi:glycosyltransferase involved in cell wall biosynthesis
MPPKPTLSVLIPVFDEAPTLERLLDAVEARPEVTEVVIVDDGSSDGTAEILGRRRFVKPVQIIRHAENRGKGSAVRTAIGAATGELAVIQDADLELDPSEYARLLEPFSRPDVSAVYGARTFHVDSLRTLWLAFGNKLVTLWTNLLFRSRIHDMETCYKLLPLGVWRSLDLQANRFDIEPEITAKLLRAGHHIVEVPISYSGRGAGEGKKLGWRDGVEALWTLTRIRFGRAQPTGTQSRSRYTATSGPGRR